MCVWGGGGSGLQMPDQILHEPMRSNLPWVHVKRPIDVYVRISRVNVIVYTNRPQCVQKSSFRVLNGFETILRYMERIIIDVEVMIKVIVTYKIFVCDNMAV